MNLNIKNQTMNWKFLLAVMCTGVFTLYLTGCSKESEDKLTAANPVVCDTTNVSYSKQILNILQDNCYTCHHSPNLSSGIELGDYNSLRIRVDNGDLVHAVTHTGNVTPMPYGLPMLPACEVNTIVAWVNQGAQNN